MNKIITAIAVLAILGLSCSLSDVRMAFQSADKLYAARLLGDGITVQQGQYYITFSQVRIDDIAHNATGGLVIRWLVANVTVSDTCRNVLAAGIQRFPLQKHECPPPLSLLPVIVDTTREKSGGSDR
jgi:hypothetical protein